MQASTSVPVWSVFELVSLSGSDALTATLNGMPPAVEPLAAKIGSICAPAGTGGSVHVQSWGPPVHAAGIDG